MSQGGRVLNLWNLWTIGSGMIFVGAKGKLGRGDLEGGGVVRGLGGFRGLEGGDDWRAAFGAGAALVGGQVVGAGGATLCAVGCSQPFQGPGGRQDERQADEQPEWDSDLWLCEQQIRDPFVPSF